MHMRNKSLLLGAAVLLSISGVSSISVSAEEVYQNHKIGVVVYDINDNEVQMFRSYYENYITDNFPVEFLYSASVGNWEEEKEFLENAVENGVEGFISFFATNLPEALEFCEDSEVYYMMGSGNISQDWFTQAEDNEWFLGCIGPNDETDRQAGVDMVTAYQNGTEQAGTRFLVTTGGSLYGNHMHEMRAVGILEELAEQYHFQYDQSIEEIVMAEKPFAAETDSDEISIIICPGYDVPEKLQESLESYDCDAVFSVLGSDSLVPLVTDAEKSYGHDIWVGVVDCFSQWNQDLFQKKDAFHHSSLNYVAGKYGSEIGPSFAAMFQAITMGTEMLKPEGKAFHLNQGFWTADSAQRYNELFGYTQAIAVNAYSNLDLMNVIQLYNPDADFESFKELTEAYEEEQALKRMGM